MKTTKEITCIVCPIGCKIKISTDGKSCKILSGDKCKRGTQYAYSEALNPERMLTSSILVSKGEWPLVSVKTSQPVPKQRIFDVMAEIKKLKVKAPVSCGQIVIKDVCNLNIDVVATKTVDRK